MFTGFFGSKDSKYGNILYGSSGIVSEEHDAIDVIVITDEAQQDASFAVSATDSVTLTDSATGSTFLVGNATDTLTSSDTATGGVYLINLASDTLTITDKTDVRWTRQFLLGDNISMFDDTFQKITKDAADVLVVTDTAAVSALPYALDNLGIGDQAEGDIKGRYFFTEYANISDEAFGSRVSLVAADDIIYPVDESKKWFVHDEIMTDSLLTTDFLLREVFYVTTDDTITESDVAVSETIRIPRSNDTLAPVDQAARGPSDFHPRAADVIPLNGVATGSTVAQGFKMFPDVNNPDVNAFMLPEPELNNRENSINRLQKYRSETGALYTYVQRTNRWRIYNWSFVVSYAEYRALESYLYARGQVPPSISPQNNLNLYVNWRADKYRLRSTTASIQAAHIKSDRYRVELSFEGICYSYGGGRVHVPC